MQKHKSFTKRVARILQWGENCAGGLGAEAPAAEKFLYFLPKKSKL